MNHLTVKGNDPQMIAIVSRDTDRVAQAFSNDRPAKKICCDLLICRIKRYDLSVFITADPETRRKRILLRNGEKASMFFTRWMPLEDAYFEATGAEKRCTLSLPWPDTPLRVPLEEAL